MANIFPPYAHAGLLREQLFPAPAPDTAVRLCAALLRQATTAVLPAQHASFKGLEEALATWTSPWASPSLHCWHREAGCPFDLMSFSNYFLSGGIFSILLNLPHCSDLH